MRQSKHEKWDKQVLKFNNLMGCY